MQKSAEDILKELKINAKKEKEKIKKFLLKQKDILRKEGAIIGLSGGLDSSVCAFLLKECFGKKVFALILPEKDSNLENIQDARNLAKALNIKTEEIELTKFFEEMKIYKLFPKLFSQNRKATEFSIKNLRKILQCSSLFSLGFSMIFKRSPPFYQKIFSTYVNRAAALASTKTRMRMVFLYHYARLKNYFVCGTTDKTEWSIGFYDGDVISDVQPLLHLYKTQIKQLAHYLDLPKKIIEKPSSGDLFAKGIPNETIIGFSYETLDSVLYCLEKKYPKEKIKKIIGINEKELEAIFKLIEIEKIRKLLPINLNKK